MRNELLVAGHSLQVRQSVNLSVQTSTVTDMSAAARRTCH